MNQLSVVWLLTLVVVTQTGLPPQTSGDLIVTSPAGTFQGAELTSPQGLAFAAYRGIPYAKPPVGPLRFVNPQFLDKLEGTHDATKEGPMCIQPQGIDIGGIGFGQEDCLYLNVYTPRNVVEGPLKVMVYIHGGGGFMGSANEIVPGDLVAKTEVIVVTINYRLNWLGFLNGGTVEMSGDQGVRDMVMALRWVQTNIRDFGGDSGDVTVAGHSTGGFAVSFLAIMPEAKDLFTKGMLLSESAFFISNTFGSMDQVVPTLAKQMGCPSYNTSSSLKCLRELPESKFNMVAGMPDMFRINSILDEVLPQPMLELMRNETYLRELGFYNKTYLASMTNNEGIVGYYGVFGVSPLPDQENYYDHIAQFFHLPTPVFERALLWYGNPSISEISPLFDIMSELLLYGTLEPFLDVFMDKSDGLVQSADAQGSLYFMKFDGFPAFLPPPHRGMFHGMELPYLFDMTPDAILKAYYDMTTDKGFIEDDFWQKNLYLNITRDFMKYGDPGRSMTNSPRWPPFEQTTESYLSMTRHPEIRQWPLKERKNFWKNTIPVWLAEHSVETGTRKSKSGTNSGNRGQTISVVAVVTCLWAVRTGYLSL